MHDHRAYFRFYEELNDFLPPGKRKREFEYAFDGAPAIKDPVEALGVPHTEVDLILVNGVSVDFTCRLQPEDHVSVYPVFEQLDISPLVRLRPKPLRVIKFILDVQLGTLSRLLRLLGFDTLYRNDFTDREIVQIARDEHRIILTRDRGLLKRKEVVRGFWIRSIKAESQIREVLGRLDLFDRVRPFKRCIICNDTVLPVSKEEIRDRLPARTRRYFHKYVRCPSCGRIYWPGSHYERMLRRIQQWLQEKNTENP